MEFCQVVPPNVTANAGCYQCGETTGVVTFDRIIEGEGVLAICGGCILTAAQMVWAAREAEDARRSPLEGRFVNAVVGDADIVETYAAAGAL